MSATVYEAKNALLKAGFTLNLKEVRDFPHVLEARYEDVEAVLKGIGYTGMFLTERTLKAKPRREDASFAEEEGGQLSLWPDHRAST